MDFLNILSQPITQIAGVVAVIAAMQKAGIDVGAIFKVLFGVKQTPLETIDADNRNAMQQLLTSMEKLSGYYNHDTTALLTEIRDTLGIMSTTLTANFMSIHSKHDEWDRRGIPTEDCKSKK